MLNDPRYLNLKKYLSENLSFLADKPEETVESTLAAFWLTASGTPVSVEKAITMQLPELSADQFNNLQELIQKRLNNTPVAHITGRQQFLGIELLSDKRALIPRKETEILGNKALDLAKQIGLSVDNPLVMDICCGAGNLGVALACFNPKAKVFATDLSAEAVELTSENITFLGLNNRVHASQGDLFSAFDTDEYYNKVDLVVCNPPYISSAKVSKMNAEIAQNEPVLAFDGGMLGTKIILRLIGESPKFLKSGAWLVFEIGLGQGPFILQLCERSENYSEAGAVEDSAGNIRAIFARRK